LRSLGSDNIRSCNEVKRTIFSSIASRQEVPPPVVLIAPPSTLGGPESDEAAGDDISLASTLKLLSKPILAWPSSPFAVNIVAAAVTTCREVLNG
jgi:hypothetical protein